jgi:hypothetical protein
MRWLRIISLVGVVLGGSVLTATAQTGSEDDADPTSVDPIQVLSGSFAWVAIAIDAVGGRHVVASSSVAGFEAGGDLWYATDRSGSWVTELIQEGRGCDGSWVQPDIAVDTDQSVHIVATLGLPCDTPTGSRGIYHITDRGRSPGDLGSLVRVTRRGVEWPSLAVRDGTVALAYDRVEVPRDPTPVSISIDRSGEWVTERIADDGSMPSLQLDSGSRAHIVFGDRRGLRYGNQATAGGPLSTPERIPPSRDATGAASLDLDADGRPAIAWVARVGSDARLHWLPPTASGWGGREQLGPAVTAALSFDGTGRPHIASATSDQDGGEVSHGVMDGGVWTWSSIATLDSLERVDIDTFGSEASVTWAGGPEDAGGVWVTAKAQP